MFKLLALIKFTILTTKCNTFFNAVVKVLLASADESNSEHPFI